MPIRFADIEALTWQTLTVTTGSGGGGGGGTGDTFSPSANSLTWSTLAPTIPSVTVAPTVASWGHLTPQTFSAHSAPPNAATWQRPAPTARKADQPAAAAATWQPLAATHRSHISAQGQPASARWGTMAPGYASGVSPQALPATWNRPAPTAVLASETPNPTPTSARWHVPTPQTSKGVAPAPLGATWQPPPVAALLTSTSVDGLTSTWTIPAPSLRSSIGPIPLAWASEPATVEKKNPQAAIAANWAIHPTAGTSKAFTSAPSVATWTIPAAPSTPKTQPISAPQALSWDQLDVTVGEMTGAPSAALQWSTLAGLQSQKAAPDGIPAVATWVILPAVAIQAENPVVARWAILPATVRKSPAIAATSTTRATWRTRPINQQVVRPGGLDWAVLPVVETPATGARWSAATPETRKAVGPAPLSCHWALGPDPVVRMDKNAANAIYWALPASRLIWVLPDDPDRQ